MKKLAPAVGRPGRRGFPSWRTAIELVVGGGLALWAADLIGPDEIDYTSHQHWLVEGFAEDWVGPGTMASCPPLPRRDLPTDSWGRELRLICGEHVPKTRSVIVISAGPDGLFDTRDDVRSGSR